jgi:predicted TIM-barrel fold metal-dependent hydrolase
VGAIDFHTHAFPDALAARAVRFLEAEGGIDAWLPGTVSALLESMDRAGIERSVVATIATRPKQFDSIFAWAQAIASPRILPFPSIHPADPDAAKKVKKVAEAGFRGVKLHPYYQDFCVDEQRLFPIYAALQDAGLAVLLHTGFDMAYERVRVADPSRCVRVKKLFPRLKLVAAHLGAWKDWGEVREHMLGRPIYMDLSYSLDFMTQDEARELILGHPREYLLFGTDSPWAEPTRVLKQVHDLHLDPDLEADILHRNAARLLSLA